MPSRLERRYARMPDEELLVRSGKLDTFSERERVTILEELSARRLPTIPHSPTERLSSPKATSQEKKAVSNLIFPSANQLIYSYQQPILNPNMVKVMVFFLTCCSVILLADGGTLFIGILPLIFCLVFLLFSPKRNKILVVIYADRLLYLPWKTSVKQSSSSSEVLTYYDDYIPVYFKDLASVRVNTDQQNALIFHRKNGTSFTATAPQDSSSIAYLLKYLHTHQSDFRVYQ